MRLIDADRLMTKRMQSKYYHLLSGDIAIPIIDIEHAPSVELPEIVRCKECRFLIDHYGFMDDGYCANMRDKYGVRFKPDKDWFCADGELK